MKKFELSFTIHKNNGLRTFKQTSHAHNICQSSRALQINPRRQWLDSALRQKKGNTDWIGTMKTDNAIQCVVIFNKLNYPVERSLFIARGQVP